MVMLLDEHGSLRDMCEREEWIRIDEGITNAKQLVSKQQIAREHIGSSEKKNFLSFYELQCSNSWVILATDILNSLNFCVYRYT